MDEFQLIATTAAGLEVCRGKAISLGIEAKCTFIRGDFFAYPFDCEGFDTSIVGFFISHLPEEQEHRFFDPLRRILRPHGRFIMLDSIWNDERARTRAKSGRQQRKLNDGRTFDIFKRYFEKEDIAKMASRYGLSMSVIHAGGVFIAAEGRFQSS